MLSKKLIVTMMTILMLVAGSAIAGGDVAKGKILSDDCANCHGDDGLGYEDVPAIAGMDAKMLTRKLADFKSGAVESEMNDFLEAVNEQDMLDLAAYYATLPGK